MAAAKKEPRGSGKGAARPAPINSHSRIFGGANFGCCFRGASLYKYIIGNEERNV